MSILELGAAEDSYLPDGLKTSRHVGVGLNQKLMDENPALTDTMIVNLNNVVEDRDVDDDNFRMKNKPLRPLLLLLLLLLLPPPPKVRLLTTTLFVLVMVEVCHDILPYRICFEVVVVV